MYPHASEGPHDGASPFSSFDASVALRSYTLASSEARAVLRGNWVALVLALVLALWAMDAICDAQAPTQTTGTAAASLKVAISLPNAQTNGVAISPGGRTFMVIAKQPGQDVPQVAEYVHGQLKPYPDAQWNGWKPGMDATRGFVHANSIRFDPEGVLWVVDFGAEKPGKSAVVPGGVKLVSIDIRTNQVKRVIPIDPAVLHPNSAVDDVRFNGDHAYLTDAGWPGLIVIHMPEAMMWRALSEKPSTTAHKPLRAEGHELLDSDGKPIFFHADQLELAPDGKTLFYQPCSGPMSAIETRWLDDSTMMDPARVAHVRRFTDNGTAGGTAIDSKGNLYVSDADHDAVLKVTPDGRQTTLVRDPRLIWVDAMWITADGRLWMPAVQIDRTPDFNHGKMTVKFPMQVFTVDIGNGPPANDHK